MAVTTGGVQGELGEPGRVLKRVMERIWAFAPRQSDDDYVLDLGFFTWHASLGPPPPGSPTTPGVSPGMVGRIQRRFIVWVAPPQGLGDEASLLAWLLPALDEVALICREYLPTKSRRYPAELMAQEAEALAKFLASPTA